MSFPDQAESVLGPLWPQVRRYADRQQISHKQAIRELVEIGLRYVGLRD